VSFEKKGRKESERKRTINVNDIDSILNLSGTSTKNGVNSFSESSLGVEEVVPEEEVSSGRFVAAFVESPNEAVHFGMAVSESSRGELGQNRRVHRCIVAIVLGQRLAQRHRNVLCAYKEKKKEKKKKGFVSVLLGNGVETNTSCS
jgi:hypothetical protein